MKLFQRGVCAALCLAALTAFGSSAQAQITGEQQNALRQNCRSDFMSKCSGVTPGGKDALACLQKNVATLSPNCKQAVSATLPPAPPPTQAARPATLPPAAVTAPPPPAAPATKSATAPTAPAAPVVSAPPPRAKVAPPKRNTFTAAPVVTAPGPAPQAAPAAVTTAPPATPVARPPKAPLANAAVMLRACKLDLVRHCRGVEPGGGRALACLSAHEKNLTIRCRTAMKVTSPLR